MISFAYDSSGSFTATLAKGRIWRQVHAGPHIARWRNPAATYLVSIAPGVLDSYDMRVAGAGASIRRSAYTETTGH